MRLLCGAGHNLEEHKLVPICWEMYSVQCDVMRCHNQPSYLRLGPADSSYTSFRSGTIVTLSRKDEKTVKVYSHFRYWLNRTPIQSHISPCRWLYHEGCARSHRLNAYFLVVPGKALGSLRLARPMKSGRGAQCPSAEQQPELAISPSRYSREQRIRQK